MKLMRRWVIGVAVLAGVAALAPLVRAQEEMWRNFRGRIVFTDIALAPESNFENVALMTSALKRLERTTIDQRSGFWRIHVLAFLDRPAATRTLVLRASEVTDPKSPPRQVRVFEVPIERGQKELRMDDFVVTTGMGFATGARYELALEAPPEDGTPAGETKAGKADVYAKGVITLR